MIIIEDDIVVKKNKTETKLFFEEENLSEEETAYRDAVRFMEAVDCVTRFERAEVSFKAAAHLFEQLGEYKDSARRRRQCEEQAEKVRKAGMEKAYETAVKMQKDAHTEMDYRTVISEFERFSEYRDSMQRIEECKKTLRTMSNRTVWKNRAAAVGILALALLIFWISPAKPMTKGIIRMRQGHYSLAVKHFNEAGDFLNSTKMKKKCRYQQALKAQENGDLVSALALCKKADGLKEADIMSAGLELRSISQAQPGDTVVFGKKDWTLLSTKGKKAVLFCEEIGHMQIFSKKDHQWTTSRVRKWMNDTYKDKILNQGERKLLQEVVHDAAGEKADKLYLLSVEEYQTYQSMIKISSEEWWLRDAGKENTQAAYVSADGQVKTDGDITGKKNVFPVIEILLDEALLEENV